MSRPKGTGRLLLLVFSVLGLPACPWYRHGMEPSERGERRHEREERREGDRERHEEHEEHEEHEGHR